MSKSVKVWDILVRLFHWSLVLTFTIAYLTGEEDTLWHIYSGYAVSGLIAFRLAWGFVGTKYARFTNFVTSPSTLILYLKSLRRGHPQHYFGHNPAGGWMIIVMLLSLIVVTISGLKLYAIEEGKGPLAEFSPIATVINSANADDDKDRDDSKYKGENNSAEFWEELHELSSHFTVFLIFLHIAGVYVSGRLHNENLVKAMITGKKKTK